MQAADCKQVEIIGWLYQFYISEKKDEVFASKSKVKKEDIPAATQLFTPRWIVEYMVQNTVGKLWLQNRPHSKLREFMPYYIESPSAQSSDFLKVDSVEEIRLLDQAAGSGHILVYGFELFTRIYEEEGYNQDEIPALIIRHNLFGFEIDERAAQLAAMVLMMKARSYNQRVFQKELYPHITCFRDLQLNHDELTELFNHHGLLMADTLATDLENMRQATNFGSLIIPQTSLSDLQALSTQIKQTTFSDAFLLYKANQVLSSLAQLISLGQHYHCIVDNPPYMGSGNLNNELASFVKLNYPDSKSDLMACFMEAGLHSLLPKGFLGMINQHSWMFLSSYESLRKKLIDNTFFDTMLHLGSRTFPEIGGEVVQNTAFAFWKSSKISSNGVYFRLVDFDKPYLKREKTIEAIKNNGHKWRHSNNQRNFEKIEGSPICYWTSEVFFTAFDKFQPLDDFVFIDGKNVTANNDKFFRFQWEVCQSSFASRFIPIAKGGDYRKWQGNIIHLIDWNDKAKKEYKTTNSGRLIKPYLWFKDGLTFSRMSKVVNCREIDNRGTFDGTTVSFFFKNEKIQDQVSWIQAFFNSAVGNYFVKVINPTLVFQFIDLKKIPIALNIEIDVKIVEECNNISKLDWNKSEIAIDNKTSNILDFSNTKIHEAIIHYQMYWTAQFFQLHRNEEELNQQFIEIYGLQEELTPDVPLEDISILQQELDRTALKKLNNKLVREEGSMKVLNYDAISLPFEGKEIIAQLISYAVGCMFGRYSLQKEGLILANQGEDLADYLQKLEIGQDQCTFLPDEDNIIPVLDEEWFEDDIVTRFQDFLKVAFGSDHFEENLAFIEQQLGKPLRKYFTRDFYTDHVRRYKKRPIYWLFSSGSGTFSVLIYIHRYTPDTVNNILNKYLRQFQEKIRNQMLHLDNVMLSGSASEQSKASREKDWLNRVLMELQEYEREVIYPMATDRIPIDLDDGVLVNYNKFGKAVKEISGLNDKKTKAKVKKFDWIDQTQIR